MANHVMIDGRSTEYFIFPLSKLRGCFPRVVLEFNFCSEHDVGKVYAMQSSHNTEMPTARGVFGDRQLLPYANFKLRNKLRKYDKVGQEYRERQAATAY